MGNKQLDQSLDVYGEIFKYIAPKSKKVRNRNRTPWIKRQQEHLAKLMEFCDDWKIQVIRNKLQALELIQCFSNNPESQPIMTWVNLKQTINNVLDRIQNLVLKTKVSVYAKDVPSSVLTNELIIQYILFSLCTINLQQQFETSIVVNIFSPTFSNDCLYLQIQFQSIPNVQEADYQALFHINNYNTKGMQKMFTQWGGSLALGLALQLCDMKVESVNISQLTCITIKTSFKQFKKPFVSFKCETSNFMEMIEEELSSDELSIGEEFISQESKIPECCNFKRSNFIFSNQKAGFAISATSF